MDSVRQTIVAETVASACLEGFATGSMTGVIYQNLATTWKRLRTPPKPSPWIKS